MYCQSGLFNMHKKKNRAEDLSTAEVAGSVGLVRYIVQARRPMLLSPLPRRPAQVPEDTAERTVNVY